MGIASTPLLQTGREVGKGRLKKRAKASEAEDEN